MALPYDPSFTMGITVGTRAETDQNHDESVSAAMVAVDLISSARLALKLDSVYTEYSAQYLLDIVGSQLTVKDCLEFALNKGIPKAEDWPHLGSVSNPPALVSMKGKVIEAKNLEEAYDLLVHQPVGAKLHVFSPHIELQQDGIYCGPSGEPATYVGLRDGIIVRVEKIYGKTIGTVKLWYNNKFTFFKVALGRRFVSYSLDKGPDAEPNIPPTALLVEFCVPRLSIN